MKYISDSGKIAEFIGMDDREYYVYSCYDDVDELWWGKFRYNEVTMKDGTHPEDIGKNYLMFYCPIDKLSDEVEYWREYKSCLMPTE